MKYLCAVLESSEWPSVGLFSGKLFHTGDWDECLKASGPASIKGKYCLVQAHINVSAALKSERTYFDDTGWPDEGASAWDIIDAVRSMMMMVIIIIIMSNCSRCKNTYLLAHSQG